MLQDVKSPPNAWLPPDCSYGNLMISRLPPFLIQECFSAFSTPPPYLILLDSLFKAESPKFPLSRPLSLFMSQKILLPLLFLKIQVIPSFLVFFFLFSRRQEKVFGPPSILVDSPGPPFFLPIPETEKRRFFRIVSGYDQPHAAFTPSPPPLMFDARMLITSRSTRSLVSPSIFLSPPPP